MSDPSNKKSTTSSSGDAEDKEEGETNTGSTMAAVPDIDRSTAAEVEAKSERKRAKDSEAHSDCSFNRRQSFKIHPLRRHPDYKIKLHKNSE